jgi:hypothetical protein
MSRARTLLVFALLALASIAQAEGVRLLAPAAGTTLRGGSSAELHWSATQLPEHTEEWEAFLSVDGGKYYGFRVTPHLDIRLQRFTFVVPNIDTRDARILLRTGNEARETEYEIPGSFAIVRDAEAEPVAPRPLAPARGEAARKGDPAVLAWADGARDGSGVTQQSSAPQPITAFDHHTLLSGEGFEVLEAAANHVAAPSLTNTQPAARNEHARGTTPLLRTTDLLLMCRRRNI